VSITMIHPDDKTHFLEFFDLDAVRDSFKAGRECLIGEFRKLWQDGGYHWSTLTLFPAGLSAHDEIYLVFIMDIGEKKKVEELTQRNHLLEQQRLADERYRIIIDQTDTLVFEWSRDNDARFISPEIPRRFAGEYDGRDLMHIWQDDAVIHPMDEPLLTQFLINTRKACSYTEMTIRLRTHSGQHIWCKVALTCIKDEQGQPKRYIGTLNDVDQATRSILALKYRAEYDTLTGVYNMQTFHARATQLLHQNPERHYSIIRMDIDRFKVINDLYGMEEGDLLLKTIARLLSERMSPHSVCGHFSGDIFCACVDFSEEHLLDFVNELTIHLADYPLTSRVVPSFGICKVDT
ncbi:MAG: diguanylate cyclase, partial [Bilophila sp.]